MNPYAFIFIGRSGCGKGTQAGLLKSLIEKNGSLPVFYIETGEKFRTFIKSNGYVSSLSNEVYKNNDRQPDFLGTFMWSDMLINDLKGSSHLILDGVARSINEANILETALFFLGIKDIYIIHLKVGREWSEKHLKARGRFDDEGEEAIRKRLNWFDKDVMPAIDFLKNSNNHFVEVNGEQSIEKVHSDICSALPAVFL